MTIERYHLMRFDDTYGDEQLLLRSQGRMDETARGSRYETTEGDRHVQVVAGKDADGKPHGGGSSFTTVGGEYDLHVGKDRYEKVGRRLPAQRQGTSPRSICRATARPSSKAC